MEEKEVKLTRVEESGLEKNRVHSATLLHLICATCPWKPPLNSQESFYMCSAGSTEWLSYGFQIVD